MAASMAMLCVFFAAVAVFWLLYGLVVCPRLVDEGITVAVEHDGHPLLYHWPKAQLLAYRNVLASNEASRWFNLYLFHAQRIICCLALMYAAGLAATLFLMR
jgi:hypothetical protein|nr:hypothetical protein [uncultured Pseudoxanthomonas sp.]